MLPSRKGLVSVWVLISGLVTQSKTQTEEHSAKMEEHLADMDQHSAEMKQHSANREAHSAGMKQHSVETNKLSAEIEATNELSVEMSILSAEMEVMRRRIEVHERADVRSLTADLLADVLKRYEDINKASQSQASNPFDHSTTRLIDPVTNPNERIFHLDHTTLH